MPTKAKKAVKPAPKPATRERVYLSFTPLEAAIIDQRRGKMNRTQYVKSVFMRRFK